MYTPCGIFLNIFLLDLDFFFRYSGDSVPHRVAPCGSHSSTQGAKTPRTLNNTTTFCSCLLEVCCKFGSRHTYQSYQLSPNPKDGSGHTPGKLVNLPGLQEFFWLEVSSPLRYQCFGRCLSTLKLVLPSVHFYKRMIPFKQFLLPLYHRVPAQPDQWLIVLESFRGGVFFPFLAGLSSTSLSFAFFSSTTTLQGLFPCPLQATCFCLGLFGDFSSPK